MSKTLVYLFVLSLGATAGAAHADQLCDSTDPIWEYGSSQATPGGTVSGTMICQPDGSDGVLCDTTHGYDPSKEELIGADVRAFYVPDSETSWTGGAIVVGGRTSRRIVSGGNSGHVVEFCHLFKGAELDSLRRIEIRTSDLEDTITLEAEVSGTLRQLREASAQQPLSVTVVALGATDTITGSKRDSSHYYESLRGGGGNDFLIGRAGDDYLNGGKGDDTMKGGGGDDLMYGGIGDDTMYGGEGDDVMCGATGGDTMTGGSGSDEMYGMFGPDQFCWDWDWGWPPPVSSDVDRLNCIDGGSGDDIILGGPAEDRILGGLGNDDLDGGDGDDGISGGPGNDRIFGGSGYDALCGDSSNPKAGRDELHTQADGGEMWAERGLFTPLFVGWSYPELNGPHYCGHPRLFGNNPPNCNPTLTARPAGCP